MAIFAPEILATFGEFVPEAIGGAEALFGFSEAAEAASVTAEATESTSIFSSLPALTTKNVVGGGLVLDAGRHLMSGNNPVGGVTHDLESMVGFAGEEGGKLAGEALTGVSESLFSNTSTVELLLLAGGAYMLWQKI